MISFYLYQNPMGHTYIMTKNDEFLKWPDYVKYEQKNWIKKEIQKMYAKNDIHIVQDAMGYTMVVID